MNVRNQDGVTKILDMVPDFVNRFTSKNQPEESVTAHMDAESKAAAAKDIEEKLQDAVKKEEK